MTALITIQNQLNEFHTEYGSKLPARLSTIDDYPSLVQEAFTEELATELANIKALATCPSVKAMQDFFLKLCHSRETRNLDMAQSWQASPESYCNALYWQVALLLFAPKTLQKMLEILLPSLKQQLIFELVIQDLPEQRFATQPAYRQTLYLTAQMKAQPLSNNHPDSPLAHLPSSPHQLTEFVISREFVFCVSEISRLRLRYHYQLYRFLQKEYPDIAARLYDHNSSLIELKDAMESYVNQGLTARPHLVRFATELELASAVYTNNTRLSSLRGIEAAASFRCYLDRLSDSRREIILKLRWGNKTLSDIMADLAGGDCIQIAAMRLRTLLADSANTAVLDDASSLDNTKQKQTVRYYDKSQGKSIDTVGFHLTKKIPEEYLSRLLNRVTLFTAENYTELLINLPPSFYGSFFPYCRIRCSPQLPHNLATLLSQRDFLNDYQRRSFFEMTLEQPALFGGILAVFAFAAQTKDLEYIKSSLALLKQQKLVHRLVTMRLQVIKAPLLRLLANTPEALTALLSVYTPAMLYQAMLVTNRHGSMMLHHFSIHPDCLNAILDQLPSDVQRRELLEKENSYGHIAYFYLSSNILLLKIIEQLYGKGFLPLLKKRSRSGRTIFFAAVAYPDSFDYLLSLIQPPNELHTVLSTPDQQGYTVAYYLASTPNSIAILAKYLNPAQLIQLLLAKTNLGKNIFTAAYLVHDDFVKKLIDAIPEPLRANFFLNDTIKQNILALEAEELKLVIESITTPKRLAFIEQLGLLSQLNLSYATYNLIAQQYPEKSTFVTAITAMSPSKEGLFHLVARGQFSYETACGYYEDEETLCAAFLAENDRKETALHVAAILNLPAFEKILHRLARKHSKDRLNKILQLQDCQGNSIFTKVSMNIYLAETVRAIFPATEFDWDSLWLSILAIPDVRVDFLKRIPRKIFIRIAQAKRAAGGSLMQTLISKPKIMALLIEKIFPDYEPKKLACFLGFDELSLIFLSNIQSIEELDMIEKLVAPADFAQLLQKKDPYNRTILHRYLINLAVLRKILKIIQTHGQLGIFSTPDDTEKTPLHYLTKQIPALEAIVKIIPKANLLTLLRLKDKKGNTVLHYAMDKPEAIHLLLPLFPVEQQLGLLLEKNKKGLSVLHEIFSNKPSIRALEAQLGFDLFVVLLQKKLTNGHSVFYCFCRKAHFLKVVLALLAKQNALSLLFEIQKESPDLFHLIAKNEQAFAALLEHIPSGSQFFDLLWHKNSEGVLLASYLATQPASLKAFLNAIPRAERFAILIQENTDLKKSLLNVLENTPKAIAIVITCLDDTEIIQLLTTENSAGNTLLQQLANNEALSDAVFNHVSNTVFLKLLSEKNNAQKSLIELARENKALMKQIVEQAEKRGIALGPLLFSGVSQPDCVALIKNSSHEPLARFLAIDLESMQALVNAVRAFCYFKDIACQLLHQCIFYLQTFEVLIHAIPTENLAEMLTTPWPDERSSNLLDKLEKIENDATITLLDEHLPAKDHRLLERFNRKASAKLSPSY